MARFKSVISNWTGNKVSGILDKATDYITGVSRDDKFLLDGKPIKATYPIDLLGDERYGEMIKFSMLKVDTKANTNQNTPKADINKNVKKTAPTSIPAFEELKQAAQSTADIFTGKTTKHADLYLYVPAQSMVNATQTDWESKEASALLNSDGTAWERISGVAKGAGVSIGKALGGKIAETAAKDAQIAVNGNIESFFTGVGLRKFSFAFEFAPRSEAELKNALLICHTFKKYSLPTANTQNLFNYPMAWSFGIHSTRDSDQGKRLGLMGSDKCYITGTTLNMSPDSVWSTFNSGHPVAWTLNVSFVEDKIMDRTAYENAEFEL